MDEKDFTQNYLKAAAGKYDKTYSISLPDIKDLELCGEYIVQGELNDTFSTNLISKYASAGTDIHCTEVYKNTENKKEGNFVRLVGTMSLVKLGMPFLFLDAAVTNINPVTAEKEPLTTRVVIHIPQAADNQRERLIQALSEKAQAENIEHRAMERDTMPVFWGSIWICQAKGLQLDMIQQFRDLSAQIYLQLAQEGSAEPVPEYRLVQEQMIFSSSNREQTLFSRMGLTVPPYAQAAFFTLLTGGPS